MILENMVNSFSELWFSNKKSIPLYLGALGDADLWHRHSAPTFGTFS